MKKQTRIGRYEEQLQFEDFFWSDNASISEGTFSGTTIYGLNSSVDDQSVITENQSVITSSKSLLSNNNRSLDLDRHYIKLNHEMRKMFELVTL